MPMQRNTIYTPSLESSEKFGSACIAGGFAMTCFEAFVAFLQAYVFAILSTVYINLSFPEE